MTDTKLDGLIAAREIVAALHASANEPHKAYDAAFIQILSDLDAGIAAERKSEEGVSRWRHLKRGTTYILIAEGELQSSNAVLEGAALVAYRSEHDGRVWFRPVSEFYDGRFERLPVVERKSGEKGDEEISFQTRVGAWMQVCFGADISADREERNHRFLEEALELVQACGCTQSEAHQLVDYVYGRDQGDINQEVGGVMVTLAALCLANGFDMHGAGETELARVWTKIDKIRAKQAAKPKHSPLPVASPSPPKQPHGCPTDGAVEAEVSEEDDQPTAAILEGAKMHAIMLDEINAKALAKIEPVTETERAVAPLIPGCRNLAEQVIRLRSILTALRAGPLGTFAEGLRAAAQWHFERRQGTPDAFEYEFHQVCGNSILGLTVPAKNGTGK